MPLSLRLLPLHFASEAGLQGSFVRQIGGNPRDY